MIAIEKTKEGLSPTLRMGAFLPMSSSILVSIQQTLMKYKENHP